MVGGVHCNFYPESSLTDFDASLAAYGESEDTILDILGRAGRREFGGIPGILWRDTDGLVRRNPARPLMRDIDQLPLPARHLLPAGNVVMSDRLAGTDLAMAHVMFSRGCPFPCSFCAAGQSRIQYRSGESARDELEYLIGAYGIQGFSIVDDNFIVSKAKVADICDQVSGLRLRWSALSRVDTVDPALLAKMAASGCIEVKYGMESGSESLLKAMRKNTTRAKIRAAVHATVDAGIAAKAFIIHGFPGENEQTTDETISLLTELAPASPGCRCSGSCRFPAPRCTNSPTNTGSRARTCSQAGTGTGRHSTSITTTAAGGARTPSGRRSSRPTGGCATSSRKPGDRRAEALHAFHQVAGAGSRRAASLPP